jgi:hypothetical protein
MVCAPSDVHKAVTSATLERHGSDEYTPLEAFVVRSCLLLLLVVLAGCQTHHYVVLEETALYASPQGDAVVSTLPRYHHEELEVAPKSGAERVRVTYDGRSGFASKSAVKVFSYLMPLVDGGTDRDSEVRSQLRDAQLADVGTGWSKSVVRAIRDEKVVKGMSRRQVELAWGWPLTIRPGALDGGERWVFRVDSHTTVRRFLNDPFAYPSSYSPHLAACVGTRPRFLRREVGWVSVRMPVTEERVVELDAKGHVHSVDVRRFVSDT